MIAVLCGGVGAARFLPRWRASSIPPTRSAIVNTGDDTVLHGLAISPDLDTVTYTLAGAIDPERGWGLADESWRAMEALAALRRGATRRLARRADVVQPRRPGSGARTSTEPRGWPKAPHCPTVTAEIAPRLGRRGSDSCR